MCVRPHDRNDTKRPNKSKNEDNFSLSLKIQQPRRSINSVILRFPKVSAELEIGLNLPGMDIFPAVKS